MSRIIALGWVLVFASHSVMADHWISVGSFKNRDMAEKGLLQAKQKPRNRCLLLPAVAMRGLIIVYPQGPMRRELTQRGYCHCYLVQDCPVLGFGS